MDTEALLIATLEAIASGALTMREVLHVSRNALLARGVAAQSFNWSHWLQTAGPTVHGDGRAGR